MSISPNLADALHLEIALRAKQDGDLPAFLGAIASVSDEGLNRFGGLLAALSTQPCPNCSQTINPAQITR